MKHCLLCGAEITGRTSNNTKYCSSKCARKAGAKQTTPTIATRAKRINKVAQYVYEAYNHKCALCGWQASNNTIIVNGKVYYSFGNEIHHIQPISKGGTEEADNLILLCPNHHKQADLGLITQEELKKHIVSFELTEEQKHTAKMNCADSISNLIF